MGELIGFEKFQNKKAEKNKRETWNSADKNIKDNIPLENIMDVFRIMQVEDIHETLARILNATEGFSQTSFEKNKEVVKSYTAEQLAGWIDPCNENKWSKDPAFFRAIAYETRRRLITVVK